MTLRVIARTEPMNLPRMNSERRSGLESRVEMVLVSNSLRRLVMAVKMASSAANISIPERETSLIIFSCSSGVRKEKSWLLPSRSRAKIRMI